MAASLGGIWGFYSIRFAATGELPEGSLLVLPASGLHLAYVLDLALLVPGYALAAVLLWRRTAWGYLSGTVLLASGVVHQLNYMSAVTFQANAHVPGASAFDPLELLIVGAFLITTALLLGSLRTADLVAEGTEEP